jgi:hypothetical protein
MKSDERRTNVRYIRSYIRQAPISEYSNKLCENGWIQPAINTHESPIGKRNRVKSKIYTIQEREKENNTDI